MTKDDIRKQLETLPFQPFTIRLTDGRACRIPARDFASLSPTGRTLGMWSSAEGGMRLFDVALITEIELAEA